VKVGVWCAVSARRIAGPVFFKEKINFEKYVQYILGKFFQIYQKNKDCMAGFSKTQLLATLHYTYIYAGFFGCLQGPNY
jgi:hypothetical protein